jgi:outer membrane PBP1 activator LpoA protein
MTTTSSVSRPRILLLCLLALAMLSCTSTAPEAPSAPVEEIVASPQLTAIEDLLDRARRSASPAAESLRMDAVRLQIDTGLIAEAGTLLSSIDAAGDLPTDLRVRLALLHAELALLNSDAASAERILESALFADMVALSPAAQISLRTMRSQVYVLNDQPMNAVRERIQLAPLLDVAAQAENRNAIWAVLAGSQYSRIIASGSSSDSYELRGWLELLRLVTSNQNDIQDQLSAIDQWRNTWAQHSAAAGLPDALAMLYDIWENRPSEIALVLPVQEPLGKAISEGFMSAYYDALARGRDVPRVRIYDTSFRTDVLVLYDQAVDDGIELIIGPVLKDAVRRMQRSSRPMPVPTLALNYGDPGGGIIQDLYQFGLAPEDEIMQAADTAWAAGHRNAAVLTPAGEEYLRIQDTFVSYWSALGGRVVSIDNFTEARDYAPVIKRIFSIDASEARAEQIRSLIPRTNIEFVPRRRQDVDFIFLLANPSEGRQIKPTLSIHYAGDVPVYAMPSIYDGGTNPAANQDLNGIIFNDAPWVLEQSDPLKSAANNTWAAASGPVQRLRAMGVDAYRLYLRMEQMRAFPYMRLQGATGALSIMPDGSIHRALRNAVVLNGEATVLSE